MQDSFHEAVLDPQGQNAPRNHILLILLTLPMWSGALPIIGRYFPHGLRALWLSFCALVFIIAQSLPMRRLLFPMWPYFAWLACYLSLGLVVSPVPIFPFAITIAFYTIIFATTMSIVTSDEGSLKFFANCTQWILFFNIIFLVLIIKFPDLQSIVTPDIPIGDAYEVSKERFAGLWENPNMAGYVCIVGLILTTWATRWVAWVGRFSSVTLIYFSASRKASLMLAAILILNMLIVQRRNVKAWVLLAGALLIAVPVMVFGNRFLDDSLSKLATDRKISRIVDITEKDSGEGTRVDLLKTWLPIAARAPWYGYGLGAMSGLQIEDNDPRKELYIVGTHNTYLGIWVDAGPIGFLVFMLVLLGYAYRYLVARFVPKVRWALLSLMLCNLVILTVSHNHLFCAEGIIAFSLFFLLPTSPALRASLLQEETDD